MTPQAITLQALGLGLATLSGLSGCPSSGNPGDSNPSVLWLSLDMAETRVKLVSSEPPPF